MEGKNLVSSCDCVYVVVLTQEEEMCEEAGECRDEARSSEGPGPAWVPWKCRPIVNGTVDGS